MEKWPNKQKQYAEEILKDWYVLQSTVEWMRGPCANHSDLRLCSFSIMKGHLSQSPVSGTWQRRRKGHCQVLRVPILCNYMSDSNFFLTFLMDNDKIFKKAHLFSKGEKMFKNLTSLLQPMIFSNCRVSQF